MMRFTDSPYMRPTPVPTLPPGLVQLMEGMTKEVLRYNPPDSEIYALCASHMQKLLEIRGEKPSKPVLTLDQKIAKAQAIIRERAQKRRMAYDEALQLTRHDSEGIEKAQNDSINITSPHKLDLVGTSEVEFINQTEDQGENNMVAETADSNKSKTGLKTYEAAFVDFPIPKQAIPKVIEEQPVIASENLPLVADEASKIQIDISNEVIKIETNVENSGLKPEISPELVEVLKEEKPQTSKGELEEILYSISPEISIQHNQIDSIGGCDEIQKESHSVETETVRVNDIRSAVELRGENEFSETVVPARKENDNSTDKDAPITHSTLNELDTQKMKPEDKDNEPSQEIVVESATDVKMEVSNMGMDLVENASNATVQEIIHTEEVSTNVDESVNAHKSDIKEANETLSSAPTDQNLTDNYEENNIKVELESANDEEKENYKIPISGENGLESTTENNISKNVTEKGKLSSIKYEETSDEKQYSSAIALPENIGTDDEHKIKLVEETSTNVDKDALLEPLIDPVTVSLLYNTSSIDDSSDESNSAIVEPESPKPDDNSYNLNNMDLETAAITIQKVFRAFLFKSRASTMDDSVVEVNNSLDEEKQEDIQFSLPVTLKERRPLISRMDTVLQTVNEEKSLSLSTDDSSTLSSAATVIQAHVRGFLVRSKLASNKTMSTNSLLNSDGLSNNSLEHDNESNKNKTILNIHIVPEGGHFMSRDESLITSVDLSLDGSPTSSVNLHPLGYDKSEPRKQLKREDAIQSVSPPSNNSGKLSEESAKETLSPDKNVEAELSPNIITQVETPSTSTTLDDTVIEIFNEKVLNVETEVGTDDIQQNPKIMSPDEMDVVTPFSEGKVSTAVSDDNTSKLLHSGEFHDMVLPTKVSRGDSNVVRGE